MTELSLEEIEKLLEEMDELRDLYLQLRDERDSLRRAVERHNHTIAGLTAHSEELRREIFRLRGEHTWVMPPSGESIV